MYWSASSSDLGGSEEMMQKLTGTELLTVCLEILPIPTMPSLRVGLERKVVVCGGVTWGLLLWAWTGPPLIAVMSFSCEPDLMLQREREKH